MVKLDAKLLQNYTLIVTQEMLCIFCCVLIFTSCGKEVAGCKTKLDNPDKNGNGEICFYGRHVFMGYLNMPEKTEEALDNEGWLHSGDLGKHDKTGFLFITGRIKGRPGHNTTKKTLP